MKFRFWKYLIFILLLAYITSSCGPKLPSKRILFIGNSYTDLNGGLDTHLLGFAPNSKSARITPGGYTLQNHWENANTLEPMVTYGTSPGQGVAVTGRIPTTAELEDPAERRSLLSALEYMGLKAGQKMEGQPIDFVFIGS